MLAGALPGVRTVAGHIEQYGTEWDRRSRAALAGDAPLWFALGDSTAQGIGAAPGEPFLVYPDAPSLRVTVGNIQHSIADYAHRLAEAAGNQPARGGQR